MEIQPFISVIIICYNYGHLLYHTLEAIAKQTFRDFEIVFVDDGSTDNSVAVAQRFRDDHKDIPVNIIVGEKNMGCVHAYNVGMDAAVGKYLLFNDADDWMDDNCLELLASAAMENDADRVVGAYREVDDNGNILRNRTFEKVPNPWICNMQQANLFRAELFRQNNFHCQCQFADNEKTMFFCSYAKLTTFVNVPCYNYLIHTGSDTKGKEQYKKLWIKTYSINLLLSRFREVYDTLDSEDDRAWAEYETVRIYFIYIYQFLLNAPLKIKWAEYEKLHEAMCRYYPGYLKNSKISLFRREGDNSRSRFAVWCSATAEKLHMMKALLLLFHIAAKFTQMYV